MEKERVKLALSIEILVNESYTVLQHHYNMPHLVETYSRTTGLRIEKMHLYEQFFPLPDSINKYILVNSSSGQGGKNYSYYNDVLLLLKPSLTANGYKIIQVGGKDDERLRADLNLCGTTTLSQLFYLTSKASFVLSNDTSLMHAAGHYKVPFVALFSLTSPEISGAYFSPKESKSYLLPDYGEDSPSFNPNEAPKTIDGIKPEKVANAVLNLLGLEEINIETVFIGDQYKYQAIEVIPDHILDPRVIPETIINIRLDYGGEENLAYANLQNRRCNLVTGKPLNVPVLSQLRANLGTVIYEITKDSDPQFVKELHRAGVPYFLFTHLSEAELTPIKLEYVDFNLINQRPIKTRSDVPNIEKVIDGKTRFKSNKFLLSSGKIYLSLAHWQQKNAIKSFEDNISTVLDEDVFWEEQDFFYLFNESLDSSAKES